MVTQGARAHAYAPIDLSLYDSDLVTGDWSVTVIVNDVQVSSLFFTVDTSDLVDDLIPGFPLLSLLAGLAVCVWVIRKSLILPSMNTRALNERNKTVDGSTSPNFKDYACP